MKECRIYKMTYAEARQQMVQELANDLAYELRTQGMSKSRARRVAQEVAENALIGTELICLGEEVIEELDAIYTLVDNIYDAEEMVTEWRTREGIRREFVCNGVVQDCEDALAELLSR